MRRNRVQLGRSAQHRTIGIRHRVKQTAAGESHPTQLAVHVGGASTAVELKSEEDELKFLKEGIQLGDVFLMSLGGSGDRLAYALARVAATKKGCLLRVPPRVLKDYRERVEGSKDDDATHLIALYEENSRAFYPVEPRDLALIKSREALRALNEAMKARMACEQQIRAGLIGSIYCSDEGGYPEGKIEQLYEEAKANSVVLQNLLAEEAKRERRLQAELVHVPIYNQLFKPIVGVGPKIAARILTSISDIRLFEMEPDQERLAELGEEIDRIEQAVYGPILPSLTGVFATRATEWKGKGNGELHFLQLGAAAQWLRAQGRHNEAVQLQRALELHQERSNIRKRARRQGASKLKAFAGVHLINDSVQCQDCWRIWKTDDNGLICPTCQSANVDAHGTFPRRRRGTTCNWNPEVRQAMYLLGDQFNRRPGTRWGAMLLDYKRKLREKYPERLSIDGKLRYTDAHIHRMATWKTLGRFMEWLYDEWYRLEAGKPTSEVYDQAA